MISRYWCREETGMEHFEKGIGNIVLMYAGIRNEFPKKEVSSDSSLGYSDWYLGGCLPYGS